MKKIIVLIGSGVVSIPPKRGGATELVIHEISRSMPSEEFGVFVLDRKESYNKSREIIEGVNYIRYMVPKFGNIFLLRLTELVFGLRAIKKIREINNKKKVDLIHCHTVFTALPIVFLRFLLPKSKIVYTSHNPAWTVPENEIDLFNGIIRKIEGFVMSKADYATTVSDTMRENIISQAKINPKKIHRIYNFVDTKTFSPKREKMFKHKMKIQGPTVLFVGKLIPNKGVEYLIRSAAIAKREINNVTYLIAGPASFEYSGKNKWKELVKELDLDKNVVFTGALKDEELPLAYSSSDVFCFPTLRESFGMVIIEAMASGLPVITTDIPVTREVAGNAAIFVEPKNAHKIAEKVVNLLKNTKKLKTMSRNSILRSRYFDKKIIIEDYRKFYSKIS